MSEVAPKVAAPKVKKPAKPSEHPPVATMVVAAITNLKEKKGVSLAAIKKYIQTNYKGIDMDRLGSFIRKFLKKAVADGTLATAKGHAGSFKIGEKAKAAPKPKKVKKPKTPTKKAAKAKKVKTPKKKDAAKPKKAKTPKKDAKPKKAKTPKKAAKKPAAAKKTPKKPAAKKPAAKPKAAKKPAAKKPAKK